MAIVAGYDVGGAHLKVARSENGRLVAVRQILCPLWQGMDKLDRALADAASLTRDADRVAVTMTGELSDMFDNRQAGVTALVDRLVREHGNGTQFWMGHAGFGNAETAKARHMDVASTNFLATAAAVARVVPNALVVDMGSTTTDIIAVHDGAAQAKGLNDADRLTSGELVYTGLTRTALMAIADWAPFRGVRQRLVREYYATAADARRVLEQLPEGVDLHATADGRGTSRDESIARFARMFGRDVAEGTDADWRAAAAAVLDAQMSSLLDGARQVLSRAVLPAAAPVVAAGIGAGVVAELAARLGRPVIAFGDGICGVSGEAAVWATRCAPAAAVALLDGESAII